MLIKANKIYKEIPEELTFLQDHFDVNFMDYNQLIPHIISYNRDHHLKNHVIKYSIVNKSQSHVFVCLVRDCSYYCFLNDVSSGKNISRLSNGLFF